MKDNLLLQNNLTIVDIGGKGRIKNFFIFLANSFNVSSFSFGSDKKLGN
jgi:hypothetical protein|tara:strand:+ start:1013 stop:1159 length:147 start_codon:yes stop_codon:yes gene_type:complete